ncbi:MAG: hypothetical protein LRY50_15170 [Geovibrio sp.]|nr:hypothetical protein [Geovibrio sp.]
MEIRFVTQNEHKVTEVQKILDCVKVIHCPITINEIQTEDVDAIVKDKIIKAFNKIGKPVFIEHTCLYLKGLNDFPGGLTQIFWDKLQADNFSSLVNKLSSSTVKAKTLIGYCDGYKIYTFDGAVSGTICQEPRGNRDFQWDCVFVPDGHKDTFAEMGNKKNNISMRKIAFAKFNDFLKGK